MGAGAARTPLERLHSKHANTPTHSRGLGVAPLQFNIGSVSLRCLACWHAGTLAGTCRDACRDACRDLQGRMQGRMQGHAGTHAGTLAGTLAGTCRDACRDACRDMQGRMQGHAGTHAGTLLACRDASGVGVGRAGRACFPWHM